MAPVEATSGCMLPLRQLAAQRLSPPPPADYKALKDLIKESAAEEATAGVQSFSPRTTSLTVQRAADKRDSGAGGTRIAMQTAFCLLQGRAPAARASLSVQHSAGLRAQCSPAMQEVPMRHLRLAAGGLPLRSVTLISRTCNRAATCQVAPSTAASRQLHGVGLLT